MSFRSLLEQYEDIKIEIDDLKKRISELENGGDYAHDVVRASMIEYPYIGHNVHVEGYTNSLKKTKNDFITSELKEQMKRNQTLLIEMKQKIEKNIMAVKDSRMRLIIRLRVHDCLPWEKIADKIGGTGDSIRMSYTRYLEKIS